MRTALTQSTPQISKVWTLIGPVKFLRFNVDAKVQDLTWVVTFFYYYFYFELL